jgi:hypothetical protein
VVGSYTEENVRFSAAHFSDILAPMTATLPPDIAESLMLSEVGDEAVLEVTAVNPDGSVEVMSEGDEGEGEDMEEAEVPPAMPALPPSTPPGVRTLAARMAAPASV